jgi:hypothetical protein
MVNPGSFDNNVRTLKSDKLIGKLDWNISDNQTTVKHSYVKGAIFSK